MSATHTETNSHGYTATVQKGHVSKAGEFISRLKSDRALLRRFLMIGGVALVASVALVLWLIGGRYVETDDAYVQSAKLMVSTDVSGLVQDVDVKEGQHVKKGEILFRLDPQPFRIAVQNAKAQLDQTALTIDSMKQDYLRMQADIRSQAAQVDLAQRNYNRYAKLLKANAISQSTYDQARVTLSSARDQMAALERTADTQLAKLGGSLDIPTKQHPQYLEALAKAATGCEHLESRLRPVGELDGVLFVDDSQIFPSMDAMVANFAEWAKAFAPSPVAFQFGYPSDRPWWSKLEDPPTQIGERILAAAPNTEALFWVDFTVLEVFPPEAEPPASKPVMPS